MGEQADFSGSYSQQNIEVSRQSLTDRITPAKADREILYV